MTHETLNRMLSLSDTLKRRGIIQANGYPFGVRWTDRMIRDFGATPKPVSITYGALINLECIWHKGFIEVDRDGNLAVRLDHTGE